MAKPRQVCNVRGCPALATAKGRCNAHAVEAWAGRPPASERGYGWAWEKLRQQVLDEEPNCRNCGRPSTTVDHITAKARGGTDYRGNLRALCGLCRKAKDAQDAANGRRLARGV